MKAASTRIGFVTAAALLSFATFAHADVKMPAIFGDHMVLQQDIKIPVWGWADPGEDVTVTFAGKSAKTKAGSDGKWKVELEKSGTNATPQTLTVQGKNKVEFTDVLVGDVWICSGQSNMEFQMGGGEIPNYIGGGYGGVHNQDTEIPNANDSLLRLYHVKRQRSPKPLDDLQLKSEWEASSPQSVKGFSGVGYFFAKELRAKVKRPIGMIGSYWGGTGIGYWTSLDVNFGYPELPNESKQWKAEYEKYLQTYDQRVAEYPALKEKYDANLKKWKEEVEQGEEYKAQQKAWYEAAMQARKENKAEPAKPVLSVPKPVEPRNPSTELLNGFLYNAMINPIIPYGIKGAIWYQGESNVGSGQRYFIQQAAMIKDWRTRWGQGDFAFIVVQLANHKMPVNELIQTVTDWPRLRETQLQVWSIPNAGMATAVDLGDTFNIHPQDKMDVGIRLALAARKVAYGEDIVYSGPLYDSMKIEGNKIRLAFKSVGSGLEIGVPPWVSKGEIPPVASELKGFAIAGEDKKFVWANAKIEGNEVVVWSDSVPSPVAVRYGWANNPILNLYNKEKLPASPFRTDSWE